MKKVIYKKDSGQAGMTIIGFSNALIRISAFQPEFPVKQREVRVFGDHVHTTLYF
jgi:hypothetical protein